MNQLPERPVHQIYLMQQTTTYVNVFIMR